VITVSTIHSHKMLMVKVKRFTTNLKKKKEDVILTDMLIVLLII